MTNVPNSPANLRRPALLIRAARIGLRNYNRHRTLTRIFPQGDLTPGDKTLAHLTEREAAINEIRRTDQARYSVSDHVEILIALLAEWRLISAPAS